MKSIIKKKSSVGLWLESTPQPKIKDDEVLIKIKKTAICGTDLNIYNWGAWAEKNVPIPLVVGHEFVGVIVDIGNNVRGYEIGERVTGEGHITCSQCVNCLKGEKHLCVHTRGIGYHVSGCFAEYMSLPASNVFKLPDFIPDDIASIMDPFGNAVHAAMAFPLDGEDVVITGAGPIGIMAAAIARQANARSVTVTDVNPYRLDLAKKMGATTTVNIKETNLKDALMHDGAASGFTVGLEMSGKAEALNSLLETAQNGAKISLLGILPPTTQIDWDLVIFKMLTLKGIYGREIFKTWHQMVDLIEEGLDLTPIITHHYKAEEFQKGIEAMIQGDCGRVILEWE